MNDANWDQKLSWVISHSPQTQAALKMLEPAPGTILAVRFHIDLKMVPVIESLSQKFCLLVYPCHETTTDLEGWSYLKAHTSGRFVETFSVESVLQQLSQSSHFLCDLGGDLVTLAIEHDLPTLAALEGTTSGRTQIETCLRDRSPKFPILDWNQAILKREIHNEKMVGFSLWQTFSEVTRLSLHGKSVGVLGFGAVGRGIARLARSLGAQVSIYDLNPDAVMSARFEGFGTPERDQLIACGDILVTATGRPNALNKSDLKSLRDGVFLVNAGHSETEIAGDLREHPSRKEMLPHVEEIRLEDNRRAFLLAQGRLLNLSAGFGDSINGFDVTSALLVRAITQLVVGYQDLKPGLQSA